MPRGAGDIASCATTADTATANLLAQAGVHGVLKLELLGGSYRWTFVPVAGSTWTDTGSATCH